MIDCEIHRRQAREPRLRSGGIPTLLILLASLVGVELSAQQPTQASVAGRLLDEAGFPVVDAAVILGGPGAAGVDRTMLSDRAGAYRFTGLPAGNYRLRVQRLGFVPLQRELVLVAGESRALDLLLETDTLRIAGVTVEVRREQERERARFESEPGVTARVVEAAQIRGLPGLAEPDVLRAIEMLPGVVSTSDFSSAFNVRGGSADQNLILIDGFTLFNPFHLGGLFSVFNSDAVERAELFAGGFGAEFGGRVSSVLNVESRDDVPDGIEASGGISMLAARVTVRAPLPRRVVDALGAERGGWLISGRRSYFDQILRPVVDFPYHLTDLQGHSAIHTRSGGRFAITGYWGEDVLDLSGFGLADDGSAADILRLRWRWGNRVIGATWLQPLPGGWLLDSRLGHSAYDDRLTFIDFGDVDFRSRISQVTARADLSRDLSSTLSLRVGVAADVIDHLNLAAAGGTTFFASDGDGVLSAGYGSLRWRPDPAWIVEPGVRLDSWRSDFDSRTVAGPRFALKRFFGADQDIAVKFALGRYSQFVHSIRDEELPVSNDTWILANADTPHVLSDQVQFGIETFRDDGWSGSVEAYLRSFDGVIDFNLADDPNDPADDFLRGSGRSYGLDFMVRRSEGPLTGWVALSLLRARRTFPDPLTAGWEDLPQDATYPPIFDRRANLDLVAQYTTAGGIELGARWNFGSGLPYTRPIAQHFAWRYNPGWGKSEPQDLGQERNGLPVGVVLGPRNAERYPAYHRLDVTVRRSIERRWGNYAPYLQVLNIYNRRNVLFYFYDYDRTPAVRSGYSMFPFLPAIGVEVEF
jgi:hypothetical protein